MNLNDFNDRWISEGITIDAIRFADKFGEYLCCLTDRGPHKDNAMTKNQIRNFFSEVRLIQRSNLDQKISQFLLLLPKLAYAEARVLGKKRDNRIRDFRTIIEKAHKATQIEEEEGRSDRFQRFVDFLEAILAYHKSHGGKD